MDNPSIVLGVELMDQDHARIETKLAAAVRAPDDELPQLCAEVTADLAAHFVREEELMAGAELPGLHCHMAQHKIIIAELKREAGAEPSVLRERLKVAIPQLILSHIATMDRLAAGYLSGQIDRSAFDVLRLAVPEQAAP